MAFRDFLVPKAAWECLDLQGLLELWVRQDLQVCQGRRARGASQGSQEETEYLEKREHQGCQANRVSLDQWAPQG